VSVLTLVKLLQSDTTNSTAATVFARNTNPAITSAAQIPPYLYTCLPDLLLPVGTASGANGANWANYVVPKLGLQQSPGQTGIFFTEQAADMVTAAQNKDKGDKEGGEFAVVRVLCYLQNPTAAQANAVDMADLRIRYLISCLERLKWANVSPPPISVGGTGPRINPAGLDSSIDPNPGPPDMQPFCRWLQFDLNSNDARTRGSLYSINYYRIFI
jgi:hypothetical protein